MCGIIGFVGPQGTDVTSILLEGLSKLEYRGYDSAGIAVVTSTGHLELRRKAGKIANLVASVEDGTRPHAGSLGIGHTRWATHGRPNDTNAHPHSDCTGVLTVVHNGIIENYAELRSELEREGHTFRSETDTEVLSHLIERAYFGEAQRDLTQAVRLALLQVSGAYAIAVVSSEQPDVLVGARLGGGPLVVGIGEGQQFLASDIPAILKYTRRVLILDEGEIATLRPQGVSLIRLDGAPVQREPLTIEWDAESAEKGGYPHFMLKEIHEQPDALRRSLTGRVRSGKLHLAELDSMRQKGLLDGIERVVIVACGSSYNAGMIAKYVIEQWARIPVEIVTAAEFRYANPIVGPRTLCVAVTQSGETADTLVGIRQAREQGAPVIAITNVVASAITRLSDAVLYLQAGPEICVVATKTFVTSVTVLYLLGLYLGQHYERMAAEEVERILAALERIPDQAQHILDAASGSGNGIEALAKQLARCSSMMFIGRGVGYPDRFGRRAQAQGNLLHPRRGPARRGVEARLHRPARPRYSAHRHRHRLARLRKSREQHAGGTRTRRPRRRRRHRGRRVHQTPRRRRLLRATHTGGAESLTGKHPPAIIRLPRRSSARLQRRPAAEPGKIGDGGVGRY